MSLVGSENQPVWPPGLKSSISAERGTAGDGFCLLFFQLGQRDNRDEFLERLSDGICGFRQRKVLS